MGENRESSQSTGWTVSIFFFSLISIVAILPLSFPASFSLMSGEVARVLLWADNLLCAVFLCDFLVNMKMAKDRARYFWKEGGWADLVASIPAFLIVPLFHDAAVARAFVRAVRVVRIIRGIQSIKRIRQALVEKPAAWVFCFVAILTVVFIFVGAMLVLGLEENINPGINTAGDALWWATVTASTVGYGDIVPLTPGGRWVAVFLMTAGIGLFGTLTAYVATTLVPKKSRR